MATFRAYANADRQSVIALWRACGLLRPWNDPVLDILRKQAIGAELFIVGVEKDIIVSSVMGGYDGHRGWINYLAVLPDRQRGGIGRQTIRELESRLLAIGCPKVNLQIRQGNEAVVNFYKGLGYSDDGVVSMGKRLIEDHAEGEKPQK